LPGLGLRGILAAEPFQYLALEFVIAIDEGTEIQRQQSGKIKTVDQILHLSNDGHNMRFHSLVEARCVHAELFLIRCCRLHGVDPPVENHGQCTALGFRFHTEVADELAIGG